MVLLIFFSWPPPEFVKGAELLNSGGKVTILKMKNTTPISSAVDQLVPILENLKIPFLCVIDFEFNRFEDALRESGQSDLQERVRSILYSLSEHSCDELL